MTMIDLTRLSKTHRVIVAGADGFDLYVDLHLRGFSRVSTTATCRFPCGQHDVALIAGQHSIQALQAILARIAPYLNVSATVAVWVSATEQKIGNELRITLERLGFRIEAGAKCDDGFVILAQRCGWNQIANAA
jgi:hypothetical protein